MKGFVDWAIEQIFAGYLTDVTDVLTQNIFEGGFSTAWEYVARVMNDILVPIGVSLMVIYFLVALIDKSSSGQFNFEAFFKCFIQLVVATLLVTNLMDIVNAVLSVGHVLIGQLADVSASDAATAELVEEIKEMVWADGDGILTAIGRAIQLILPFFMSVIIHWGVLLISYTRIIELMVTTMFMPLSMGDIFTEGIHGAAMRNIKRLLAVSLQGFGVYAVCVLFSYLQTAIFDFDMGSVVSGDFWAPIGTTIVLGFSCLATCFKVLPMIKDALGVH